MIGKDQIAEATRYADARAEELGLPGWCSAYDISLDGLVYVAEQRALRAVALGIDNLPQTALPTTARRPIRLSSQAAKLTPLFAATWMDAFAAGFTTKQQQVDPAVAEPMLEAAERRARELMNQASEQSGYGAVSAANETLSEHYQPLRASIDAVKQALGVQA